MLMTIMQFLHYLLQYSAGAFVIYFMAIDKRWFYFLRRKVTNCFKKPSTH